jgi:hypothetical protein
MPVCGTGPKRSVRENADIDTLGLFNQAVHMIMPEALPPFLAQRMAHENLRDAALAREAENGVDRFVTLEQLNFGAMLARESEIFFERRLILG